MSDNPTPARPSRKRIALAAAALLAVGGATGAVTVASIRPSVTMAPAVPVAIRSLQSDTIVTVRGRVAEVYGNKFILADASGRALVDTGRAGDDGDLVKPNDAVTVQGRFGHGLVRAAFLVGADGKVSAIGPMGGPRGHGPDGRRRDHDARRGPPPAPPAAPEPGAAADDAEPAAER